MNSGGIGLLVTLLIRANRHASPQRLAAVGLSEHYRHIFELTRLNEAIRLYPTEADALHAAAGR
jgi:anti-sigma B factor antagonist